MASFPVISNNFQLNAREIWRFDVRNSKISSSIRTPTSSLYTSSSSPVALSSWNLSCNCSWKSQSWLNAEAFLKKRENCDSRRRFSLRLRPRLRLFSSRLKRVPIKSVLSGVGNLIRKNRAKVTLSTCISVVLGLCFLFLKVTAKPLPKIVPYSELVSSIQNGVVSKVLFEEGTRRIYYNMNSVAYKEAKTSENEVLAPESKVADKDAKTSEKEDSVPTKTTENEVLAHESKVADDDSRSTQSVRKKVSKGRDASNIWQFSTRKIDHDEGYLLNLMREKGTSYGSAPQSLLASMRSLLITVLSLWIPLTPLMWLLYRQLTAANSPAKKRKPSNQLIGFDDVEGVDTAKTELMEVVSCLKGAINYSKLGAKLPRGVLLVGPPGTGKTLLARAVAGEAGVPFFSVSASEFVELFVGRGAARIRDLFSVARKNAPSIIFIDELDAVGGKRGRSFNDERDQTLNQLLTEMDGFETGTNVVVIGATNRPEALDQALCRPGRFSRKVYVGEPDEDGRRKILAIYFREIPLEEDLGMMCNLVASLTEGLVGADLANIVNEAALLAGRRGGEYVSREDVMEAIERAKFGINDKGLRATSFGKELGKLFPWMPSLISRNNDTTTTGPLGYQTLS